MPKAKIIATPIKDLIVSAKESGKTDRAVAAQFGISHQAVNSIYKRHRAGNDLHRRPKSGRPKCLNMREERSAVRQIFADPTKNSNHLVSHVKSKFGKNISRWTAQRILNRARLFAHRPAYKPLITEKSRKARLEFARGYENFPVQMWEKVLFSDEAPFTLYNAPGGQFIRRPRGQRYNPRYFKSTVKFGGRKLMVWGTGIIF